MREHAQPKHVILGFPHLSVRPRATNMSYWGFHTFLSVPALQTCHTGVSTPFCPSPRYKHVILGFPHLSVRPRATNMSYWGFHTFLSVPALQTCHTGVSTPFCPSPRSGPFALFFSTNGSIMGFLFFSTGSSVPDMRCFVGG